MDELRQKTLNNIKITRNFSFDEINKKTEKRVRYATDTKGTIDRKKSTTSFDYRGDIVRPIVINNKYYIRHDQIYNKMATYGIF